MSDEGEKTCPLCAEEMDLTDQQLKPCRCGYEVCVWCWHHIMEMAEKEETEGRCPACRTPYDKEKIVGTAANCERLAAEVSMEKKHKSQKAKSKTSENRKQLTSVRVIQRNLVYIVGLPLDLADEDLLQSKEYFGQYGKVLKVSISRTSAGTIQQFQHNTCSVYITYAREDEAFRCIQSVHGFILDGRSLRACFGTTKYCHAWLRNVPCTNPDCLYLHEIGSQQDSFTKDEESSAYSRVQEITGISNNMQRRSGNVLPAPTDGYCYSSTVIGNHVVKSSSNNSVSSTRVSPPSSSSGRSGGLPPAASWGTRASNHNPPIASLASSNGPTKQSAEATYGPTVIASVVSSSAETSHVPNNVGKRHVVSEETRARQSKSKMEASSTVKHHSGANSHACITEASTTCSEALDTKSTSQMPSPLPANEGENSMPLDMRNSIVERPELEGDRSTADVNIQKLSDGVSSMGIDKQLNNEYSEVYRPDCSTGDTSVLHRDQDLQWHEPEKTSLAMQTLTSETEDDFDNQRLRDAIVSQAPLPATSPLHILSNFRVPLQPQVSADGTGNYSLNPPIVHKASGERLGLHLPSTSVSSNGFMEHLMNHASGQSNSWVNGTQGHHFGPFNGGAAHFERPPLDMGESHIISNILSLDLDSWGDSLTSQNLAKLLSENDKQEGSLKSPNSWRSQISNQSRFSFARQEDSKNHLFGVEPTLNNINHTANNPSFGQGFVDNRDPYLDRLGNGFGYHHRNMELADNSLGGHTALPSSKLPASRSQISAPPGFTSPSRPPPPGFTSHERIDPSFDFLKSGSQLQEISPFMRNPYQASPSGNSSTNDFEFMDPAILAVGKGRLPTGVNSSGIDMRQNFHVQAPGFENEFRLQLMQRSHSPSQNLRYNDARDNFSPPNNAYGFTSQHMEHSQANNASSQFSLQQPRNTVISNGQWDGWSELQSPNDMGITELLRNDRVGLDKLYGLAPAMVMEWLVEDEGNGESALGPWGGGGKWDYARTPFSRNWTSAIHRGRTIVYTNLPKPSSTTTTTTTTTLNISTTKLPGHPPLHRQPYDGKLKTAYRSTNALVMFDPSPNPLYEPSTLEALKISPPIACQPPLLLTAYFIHRR
ncbi:hypothetical protein KSS87_017270 [Heliosperma pusillum]|nr:hypothetical protein KSS87_017270 [Heliosperma pusillum]